MLNGLAGEEGHLLGELLAVELGEIGHLLGLDDALLVDPLHDLVGDELAAAADPLLVAPSGEGFGSQLEEVGDRVVHLKV